jgi:hypothetical protein
VPLPRIPRVEPGCSERRHGAPVDEPRAGVMCRKRQRDGSAAGGHPRFLGRDADRPMISGAHWSEWPALPAARSVEPSAHTGMEVSGTPTPGAVFFGSGYHHHAETRRRGDAETRRRGDGARRAGRSSSASRPFSSAPSARCFLPSPTRRIRDLARDCATPSRNKALAPPGIRTYPFATNSHSRFPPPHYPPAPQPSAAPASRRRTPCPHIP